MPENGGHELRFRPLHVDLGAERSGAHVLAEKGVDVSHRHPSPVRALKLTDETCGPGMPVTHPQIEFTVLVPQPDLVHRGPAHFVSAHGLSSHFAQLVLRLHEVDGPAGCTC